MPVHGTTLTSFRPLMQGVNGMVVASHPSAAMAGLEILKNTRIRHLAVLGNFLNFSMTTA